jgi:hypothetical protein
MVNARIVVTPLFQMTFQFPKPFFWWFVRWNGTAMRTKMAPSYANIFMGKLEKLIIQSSPHKPLAWFRFIDDVDMKWSESEENLNRFLFFHGSLVPGLSTCFDTVIMWDVSV